MNPTDYRKNRSERYWGGWHCPANLKMDMKEMIVNW